MSKNLHLKNSLKIAIAVFSILTIYYLLQGIVFAQNATTLNLTVTPATIDATANPGSTPEQKIRVRNNTSSPIDFVIKTSKLTANAKGVVVPVDSNDAYLSWISYSPSSFTALPNEWTDITVQVKVPDTAAFGYYYAITISPTNTHIQNKSGSTLIGQTVVPLLLNVKKEGATASIQLVSFAPTQGFYEYLPATFNITLTNRGNVHIRPQGNVFIQTGSEVDAAVLDFNTSNGAMLPGQKRTYTASWNDGFFVEEPVLQDNTVLRDKNGNTETHLVIHWDKLTSFRIGRYTAHLLAVYDNGTRDVPIEATATFWIFPWKIIGSALVGIVVLLLLTRIWLKWYIAREIKKSQS